jgi:hypothetical protein
MHIGKYYKTIPVWKRGVGMVMVYLPILTLPFVYTCAYLTYFLILLTGKQNVKRYSDYLPNRATHRYTLKNQITMDPTFLVSPSQSKLFWILNCTWYCPYSVALFEWLSYMVTLERNRALHILPMTQLPFILISAYWSYYHLIFVGGRDIKTWQDFRDANGGQCYVALFQWHAYLVKLIENWWCPFGHEKKQGYADAPIDKSFWHIHDTDCVKLNPVDLNNPIWNEDTANKE